MNLYALVIEDDQDAGELMVEMLRSFGFEVDLVDHPHDALFSFSTRPPDLLILDLCLPGMTGPAFLDSVGSMGGTRNLAVVAVSAVYPKENPISQAALDKGAAIFVGKPFTRDVMRIAARKALGRPLPDEMSPEVPQSQADSNDEIVPPLQDDDSPEVHVLSEDFDDQSEGEEHFEIDPETDEHTVQRAANTSWEQALANHQETEQEPNEPGPSLVDPEPQTQAAQETAGSTQEANKGPSSLPPIHAFLADRNATLVIERCNETTLWVRCAGASLESGSTFRAEMTYTEPGQRRPVRFRMLLTVGSYDTTGPAPRAQLEVTEIKPLKRWRQLVEKTSSGR